MPGKIPELAAAGALSGEELLEVSKLSGSITLTAMTLSIDGSDNSINDSGSGFLSAGFALGDDISISGFTTAANNILLGEIESIVAGKIIIASPAGDNLVTEAAGDSVTISKWVSARTASQAVGDLGGGGGGSPLDIEQDGALIQAEVTTINFAGGRFRVTDEGGYVVDVVFLPPETITESGTTADLLNSNAGAYHRFTSISAKTLTVRPDATHAIEQDAEFHIRNAGAGNLTIAAGSGVTINVPAGGTLVMEPGMTTTLKRVAENVFDLIGQTVAA